MTGGVQLLTVIDRSRCRALHRDEGMDRRQHRCRSFSRQVASCTSRMCFSDAIRYRRNALLAARPRKGERDQRHADGDPRPRASTQAFRRHYSLRHQERAARSSHHAAHFTVRQRDCECRTKRSARATTDVVVVIARRWSRPNCLQRISKPSCAIASILSSSRVELIDSSGSRSRQKAYQFIRSKRSFSQSCYRT